MPVVIVIVILLAGAGYFGIDAYHNYCERRTGLRAGTATTVSYEARKAVPPPAQESADEPIEFDHPEHDEDHLAQHFNVTELSLVEDAKDEAHRPG